MRKISQYWIEDPLRSVTQPVQFTIDGKIDISVGTQFVKSARLLNSGNLPVFKYKTTVNGTEFSYSRIFDKECVGIYSPVVGGRVTTVEDIEKTVLDHPVITFMLHQGEDLPVYGHYICKDLAFDLDGHVQTFKFLGVSERVSYRVKLSKDISIIEADNIGQDLLTVDGEEGTPGVYTPSHTIQSIIGEYPPEPYNSG